MNHAEFYNAVIVWFYILLSFSPFLSSEADEPVRVQGGVHRTDDRHVSIGKHGGFDPLHPVCTDRGESSEKHPGQERGEFSH